MDRRAKVKATFLALLAVGAVGCARPAPSLSARSWLNPYYDGEHTRCYQPLLPQPGEGPLFVRWAGEGINALAGDVNGDGRIELVVYTGERLEVRTGRTLQRLWSRPVVGKYNLALGDVDGKEGVEIVLVATETSLPHILIYDGSGCCLRRCVTRGIDRDGSGKWEAGTGEVTVTDLDGDGRGEVLLKIDTLYDLQPRGVYVYEGLTGREEWHYEIGPHLEGVTVCDVTGDGRPEVVIGTYAPANGYAANGTDDEHSYLIALTATGQLLWQRELGTAFSGVVHGVSDLEGDGQPEIVAGTFVAWGFRKDQGKILVLRGRDGKVVRTLPTPRSVGSAMVMGGLESDGRSEMVFTLHGIPGFRVIDCHLEPVGVCTQDATPAAIADVTGDGRREILAVSRTAELVVFDSDLREVDRHLLNPSGTGSGTAIVADLAGNGRTEAVATTAAGIRVLASSPAICPGLGRRRTVARVGSVEHLRGSPQGGRWAFLQQDRQGWNLCLADAQGSPVRTLARRVVPDSAPSWSPDGRYLVYAAYASGSSSESHLYLVPVPEGPRRQVTSTEGVQVAPSWSPTGDRIAFVSRPLDAQGTHLWTVDLRAGTLQQWTHGAGWDDRPQWSPDGRWIAFLRTEKREHSRETAHLLLIKRPGEAPRALITADALRQAVRNPRNGFRPERVRDWYEAFGLVDHEESDPCWSPDGRLAFRLSIAAARKEKERTVFHANPVDLWTALPDGSELTRLTCDDEVDESAPSWSADGYFLAFRSTPLSHQPSAISHQPSAISLVSANSHSLSELLPRNVSTAAFAPTDPHRIAFVADGLLQTGDLKYPRPPFPWQTMLLLFGGGLIGLAVVHPRSRAALLRAVAGVVRESRRRRARRRPMGEPCPRTRITPTEDYLKFLEHVNRLRRWLHTLHTPLVIREWVDEQGRPDWKLTLSAFFSPENMAAVGRSVDEIVALMTDLVAHRRAYRQAFESCSGETRLRGLELLTLVAASLPVVQQGWRRLQEDAAQFAEQEQQAVEHIHAFRRALYESTPERTCLQEAVRRFLEGHRAKEIVAQAVHQVAAAAAAANVEITVAHIDDHLLVKMPNPTDLAGALVNLLTNDLEAMARRASDADERTITLSAGSEGDCVRFALSDTGPGFAPEVLAAVQQGASVTMKESGGSGFRDVRAVVVPYGGELRVHNRPDRPGALVEVLVPAL